MTIAPERRSGTDGSPPPEEQARLGRSLRIEPVGVAS